MPKYFMFRCGNQTYGDCIKLKLFGQTANMGKYVQEVKKGDILFLNNLNKIVNQDNDFIEGPFYADSDGTFNIIPDAWGSGFPWQVRIKTIQAPRRIMRNDYLNFMGIPYSKVFYPFEITEEKGNKLIAALGINLHEKEEELPERVNKGVIEKDDRSKFPSNYRCEDGHYVKSLSEVLIDNWLFNHNIAHAYERIVPIKEMIVSDFFIKSANLYIEFWGLNNPEYIKRKERKLHLYNSNSLNLINLENEHIQNLDDILPNKLRKYGINIL